MRISDWSSDVCSSDLGPGCLHHGALEPPLCRGDARRVDEDDLRVAMDRHAADPSSRGLHLVRDDRDLGAQEMIDQSQLAGVQRTTHRNDPLALGATGAHAYFISDVRRYGKARA